MKYAAMVLISTLFIGLFKRLRDDKKHEKRGITTDFYNYLAEPSSSSCLQLIYQYLQKESVLSKFMRYLILHQNKIYYTRLKN